MGVQVSGVRCQVSGGEQKKRPDTSRLAPDARCSDFRKEGLRLDKAGLYEPRVVTGVVRTDDFRKEGLFGGERREAEGGQGREAGDCQLEDSPPFPAAVQGVERSALKADCSVLTAWGTAELDDSLENA